MDQPSRRRPQFGDLGFEQALRVGGLAVGVELIDVLLREVAFPRDERLKVEESVVVERPFSICPTTAGRRRAGECA